jgi:hypothetical protein
MRLRSLLLAVVALAACNGPFELESGDGFLMRTAAYSYTLRTISSRWEVDIPYTYENRTGGRVFLVNCNGYVAPFLEQKVAGGEWRMGWGAPENDCLSPPVIIEPGAIFSDTLRVYGFPPGSGNAYPQFSGPVTGIYRLRWNRALTSFQTRAPFGEELPLAQRVSNEFVLRGP